MSDNKSIIRSAGIVGLGTLLSRILGFIRDLLLARFFGTGAAISAFVVAFRIPNSLRDLIGEGASNAAFVPVFSEYLSQNKKDELWRLINLFFIISSVVLLLITTLGIICSPFIVRLIAPGFSKDPQNLLLTVKLTRVMFPYILLIGLTAYTIGILYSFKSFVTPAFGPCLLNIALIGGIFLSLKFFKEPVFGLAISVLVGGILQLFFQWAALYKIGFSFTPLEKATDLNRWSLPLKGDGGLKPPSPQTVRERSSLTGFTGYGGNFKFNLNHPGIRRIIRLLIPRTIASAVYQFNIFVDTIFASLFWLVGRGAISAIFYANRLIQFPLAVFGFAISNVTFPTMSSLAAVNDLEGIKDTLSLSLRMIFFILTPITVGFCILSVPIIRVLFQRGAFDSYSTGLTSSALLFYTFGLLAFAADKILINGFYSLKDTLTPLKTAVFALLVNVILNSILIRPLKIGGLALASSISANLNFFLLYLLLRKKIGRLNEAQILNSLFKIISASLIMGIVIILVWRNIFLGLPELARLLVTILIGSLVFVSCCAIIKVNELRQFKWISKKG